MKQWLCYFLLLFLALYVTLIYNSPSGVLLTSAMVFLPFFLLPILFTHMSRVTIKCSMIERIHEGEKAVDIPWTIINKSPFPLKRIRLSVMLINKSTGEIKKITIQEAVEAKTKLQFVQKIPELTSGLWNISLNKVVLYDPVGIFPLSKKEGLQEELIMLPQFYEADVTVNGENSTFPVGHFLGKSYPWGTERYHPTQEGDDVSHILDLREYLPGDKIRNIHWKISVKKEEVMVKVPGKSIDIAICFLVEASGFQERMLKIVYAISHALCVQGCFFCLVWFSKQEQEVMGAEVLSEEDLYLAMEEFMRQGITDIVSPVARPETSYIRLDKEQRLYHNEELIIELGKGDLSEKLLGMGLLL